MKRISIKAAILIPVFAVLLVGVTALVIVVGSVASASTGDLTDRLMDARVNEYTNEFAEISEYGYATVKGLAPVIDTLQQTSADPRTRVVEILESVILADENVLAVWTCWEPDAFDGRDGEFVNADAYHDGTGRFVPYVTKDGAEIVASPLLDYDDPVAGDFYQGALKTAKPYITDPYPYEINGQTVAIYSIAIPILRDGKAVGVVGMDINLDKLGSVMNAASILEDGSLSVIAPNGTFAASRTEGLVLSSYKDMWLHELSADIENVLANGDSFSGLGYSDVTETEVLVMISGVMIGDTGRYWGICGQVPLNTVNAASARIVMLTVSIGAALIIAAGLITLLVVGVRLKRLPALTEMARNVASGNLAINTISPDGVTTRNEITLLEYSFGDMVNVINSLVGGLNHLEDKFDKDGDTEAKIDASCFEGSYKEVAQGVNNITGGLITNLHDLMVAMAEFGDGNFDADIPKLPGRKAVMNQRLDQLRNNLKNISGDVGALANAAIVGNLGERADAGKYKGDWAALIERMNQLMEAIAQPIAEVSGVMDLVSQGNFDSKVTGDYKGGFLHIKDAMNTTVTNINSYITEISAVLTRLAGNDLDQEITREYVGSFSEIKTALNNIINTLNGVVGNITSAAEQVASGARMISESSMTLATGSSEQAASVEELSATIMTINEGTSRNAENARNAESLSENSKGNAAAGSQNMQKMLTSMEGIKESSERIREIIGVIEDIAFQTNLLALNAAVEAARAGEHGKGFAVVAEEVRGLAQRSQVAARETATLIEESTGRVNEGTDIAGLTSDALKTIVGDVDKVALIISNIAQSSVEQAAAINQVTQGLTQITEVVQNNSSTSEETASASEELSSQSEIMKGLVEVFSKKK